MLCSLYNSIVFIFIKCWKDHGMKLEEHQFNIQLKSRNLYAKQTANKQKINKNRKKSKMFNVQYMF